MTTMVRIVVEVAPEYEDPEHESGVTEEGFELIHEALSGIAETIDIRRSGN
jgi:hypothetical protein